MLTTNTEGKILNIFTLVLNFGAIDNMTFDVRQVLTLNSTAQDCLHR